MNNIAYFTQLVNANRNYYVPNLAREDTYWAILKVTIENEEQLHNMVNILSNITSHYSLAGRPRNSNPDIFWISFENEDDLVTFRLSV